MANMACGRITIWDKSGMLQRAGVQCNGFKLLPTDRQLKGFIVN